MFILMAPTLRYLQLLVVSPRVQSIKSIKKSFPQHYQKIQINKNNYNYRVLDIMMGRGLLKMS